MPVKLDVAKRSDQYKEQHLNICFEKAVQFGVDMGICYV